MENRIDNGLMTVQIAELAPCPGEPQAAQSQHRIEFQILRAVLIPPQKKKLVLAGPDRLAPPLTAAVRALSVRGPGCLQLLLSRQPRACVPKHAPTGFKGGGLGSCLPARVGSPNAPASERFINV